MLFFTSITTNYLPKARVLAESIKQHCADVSFILVVADRLPDDFELQNEPFDQVWFVEDLEIPVDNLKVWIFKHSVVELCTAIKGQVIYKLLEAGSHDQVIYMDPDTVVFNDLSSLEKLLDHHSVILTPHLTAPETTTRAIIDNEICALQHGAYNLGFLAIKKDQQGLQFAKWWRDRLIDFCYDDIPGGIFTDQKWVDLAPALFNGVCIERNPGYNVATWNLSNRIITREGQKYYVNGHPLQFFHFSGFDSGAQEAMLNIYGSSEAAFALRHWYLGKVNEAGQATLGKTPVIYDRFSNGEVITNLHRYVLRTRKDVSDYFSDADPFNTEDVRSYYHWFKNEIAPGADLSSGQKDLHIQNLEQEIARLRRYLKPFKPLKKIYNFLFKGAGR